MLVVAVLELLAVVVAAEMAMQVVVKTQPLGSLSTMEGVVVEGVVVA
jgi:hypothetical protein